MPYKDPAAKRANDKRYREANKEQVRARVRAHYERNKERIQAAIKVWRENNKEGVKARRRVLRPGKRLKLKQKAVEYLGGQCVDCGLKTDIVAVYDFHHREPEDKGDNIGRLLEDNSWKKVQEELDKCVLLCANCHRVRHAREGEDIS